MNIQRSPRRSRRFVPVGDGIASCIPTGSVSSEDATGTHKSGASIGTMPVNRSGTTPTIVYGLPRMRIVRPSASVVPPSSRDQYRFDTMTTRGAPGRSSEAAIVRPTAAPTPSTSK